MGWTYLIAAILFEVTGTTCMKLSEGFAKWGYAAAMWVCYIVCFTLLTLAMKTIDLGTAYAVWAGLGTALIAVIGIVAFKESVTTVKVVSLLLVILGIVGLNLSGHG